MMRFGPVAILACLLLAPPAGALVIRADREEAEYLEMATRYGSAVALSPAGGEGVLIAPRWVLTAAHRARALQDAKAPRRLEIAGRSHEIQAIFPHPLWKSGGENDVALILLRDAVRGIEPTPLYRASDEAGKSVVIVGHGDGRKKRAAINTVDRVTPRALALRVKPLEEASDLQGAATAGDTGGPAFLQTDDDALWVAGILCAPEAEWQSYARVSAFVPWIEETLMAQARQDADALLGDPQ
jgi:hypothetical protein